MKYSNFLGVSHSLRIYKEKKVLAIINNDTKRNVRDYINQTNFRISLHFLPISKGKVALFSYNVATNLLSLNFDEEKVLLALNIFIHI